MDATTTQAKSSPAPDAMRSPEKLALLTIRIDGVTVSGAKAVGTGFFFRFTVDTGSITLIVTNRHVIEDMRRLELRFTKETDDGRPDFGNIATFDDRDLNASWIPHPDSEVDLCVLPIASLLRAVEDRGIKLWITYVDRSFIPGPEDIARLTALEEVVMVGYPIGLFDSANNMPIFRKGVSATHPRDDYEGRKECLVDIGCFTGSSGSPVFLWGAPIVEKPNTILTGGTQWTAEGEIEIRTIPTRVEPVALTPMPINLGVVIRAERLLDFEPGFQQAAQREAANASTRPQ